MKKKPIVISSLIVLLVVVAGGVYMWNQKQEEVKAEETAFWEKQKPRIELYFQYNFNNVEKFTYTKTDQTPMGIYIEGYINDNPKYEFTADILGGNEEFNGSVSFSKELAQDLGNGQEHKNVDEILKEQEESQ